MPRLLAAAICALALSTGCIGTVKVQQSLSPSFGDLAALKTIELTGEAGEVLLRGTFTETKGSNGKILRVAEMGTLPGPNGTTSIEIDRTAGISEEEITIRLRELPYPVLCRLMADGKELAMFSTSEHGKVDLVLARRLTLAEAGK